MLPGETDKTKLQESLLAWFELAQREFPWRFEHDPYAILVAEKLLQQTAARDVVVRAYKQFLEMYPAPQKLALASVADIEELIRPLGLSYRAKELHALGCTLVERHNGIVPRSLRELLALPGVGDYSARAVLSFAFRQDVPLVDTNIARVLYRFFKLNGPMPANPARKRSLIDLAGTLIPSGRSREFNLAMIDLGALICKPTRPDCNLCPLLTVCEFGFSVTEELI